MQEDVKKLQDEVKTLRNLVNSIVYADKLQTDKTFYHKGKKLGFYNKIPVTQPTNGVGQTGNMTTPGGTNVQEGSAFYGNTAYYDSGNGKAYTIGDLVTILKNIGILEV
jgi:hypothetical protein